MDFFVAFIIFILTMVGSIIFDFTMVIPLFIGYIAFAMVAFHRGFAIKNIGKMTWDGIQKSLIVVSIMICIGFLTAMWRASGTILFFVYYGVNAITPHIFILAAFLLSLLLSYMLGTSFGVAGTMGVILMTIARAGDANLVMTAGAIMSGIYFGDRGSPASSSASLTALVTESDLYTNIKNMHKTVVIPLAITIVAYTILSYQNPMPGMDSTVLVSIRENYDISLFTIVPAILMLVLPLLKVRIHFAMLLSAATAFISAIWLQGMPLKVALLALIFGVQSDGSEIGALLAGGGFMSMFEICIILFLSCTYSSIFDATDMLAPVNDKMGLLISKIGRFGTACVLGVFSSAIFCNQTIACIVTANMLSKAHKESGGGVDEFAIDVENSVIVIAGIVPWCIASSVPLTMLGMDYRALPYAFLIYLIPISYAFTKKYFFRKAK